MCVCVCVLFKRDANEGLTSNWLFTSILLPQRPGLSCRDSNKQRRRGKPARGGHGEMFGWSVWSVREVCVRARAPNFFSFQDRSDRWAGSSDWSAYVSGASRL